MKSEEKTTTAEALLGLLSLRTMSGYEIKQIIEQSIGNFWSESFGQIYPTLKRLERENMIVAETPAAKAKASGRASRRFSLTAAGRERLASWLLVPARPQLPRNELLLKLFFGALAPVSAMQEQLRETRAIYARDVARYEFILAQMEKHRAGMAGLPYWRMTVQYGMAEARAMIAWADASMAELEEMSKEEAKAKGSKRDAR